MKGLRVVVSASMLAMCPTGGRLANWYHLILYTTSCSGSCPRNDDSMR
jgi:hypothetical protein